jgi:hypothetical protein
MKGLPLGLQETTSGFWGHSTGRDERATSYHTFAIMPPIISQKHSIVTKVCRIVTKVCREKSVWQPKAEKRLEISRNFSRQGYASDFRHTAKLSDNALMACGDVQRSQQALQCCEALVLLGVRGIYFICTIRSNMRQSYESISANLSYLTNHTHACA